MFPGYRFSSRAANVIVLCNCESFMFVRREKQIKLIRVLTMFREKKQKAINAPIFKEVCIGTIERRTIQRYTDNIYLLMYLFICYFFVMSSLASPFKYIFYKYNIYIYICIIIIIVIMSCW